MNSLQEKEETLREYASIGDLEGIRYLIDLGININSQNGVNGWTALHWASKRNQSNIIKYLIEHGADKNIKNNDGQYPFQLTNNLNVQDSLSIDNEKKSSTPTTLSIEPNYLKNPEFIYSKVYKKFQNDIYNQDEEMTCEYKNGGEEYSYDVSNNYLTIIKIRLANSNVTEFIEYAFDKASNPTIKSFITHSLKYLSVHVGSHFEISKPPNGWTSLTTNKKSGSSNSNKTLRIDLGQVLYNVESLVGNVLTCREIKIVKLPNTLVVTPADIQKLKSYQEIEFSIESLDLCLEKQQRALKHITNGSGTLQKRSSLIGGVKLAERFKNTFFLSSAPASSSSIAPTTAYTTSFLTKNKRFLTGKKMLFSSCSVPSAVDNNVIMHEFYGDDETIPSEQSIEIPSAKLFLTSSPKNTNAATPENGHQNTLPDPQDEQGGELSPLKRLKIYDGNENGSKSFRKLLPKKRMILASFRRGKCPKEPPKVVESNPIWY